MADDQDVRRVVSDIDAIISRLKSGLTASDRRRQWTEEGVQAWIDVLESTRAGVLRDPSTAHELWLVGGVARQLDAVGTTEGELAEALYSLAVDVRRLGADDPAGLVSDDAGE